MIRREPSEYGKWEQFIDGSENSFQKPPPVPYLIVMWWQLV
jgi:hypothetical protein